MTEVMKKMAALIVLGGVFFLMACGDKTAETNSTDTTDAQNEIPGWLKDFYNGGYEFKNSSIDLETGTASVVMSGKVTSSPYVQYVKVLEPQDSLWSEVYYYGDGDEIEVLLKTDSGYVTQRQTRRYPYGYGEELIFSDPLKETLDDVQCDVYETEYSVDVAEQANEDVGEEVISEPLTAVVTQKYYVDPEKDELIRIETDLTDLTAKTSASVFMMSQGISFDKAMKKVSDYQTMDVYEITAYDDDLSIKIPDHN